ncbi:MAG: hypothetical protein QXD77_02460 [Candidatus Aenigmatarchaeota archaeon]
MDIAEIFDRFGVETDKALVIDRSYIPNSATVAELVQYSIRVKKPLNMVKRRDYVSVINSKGWVKVRYSDLDKESIKALEDALEKADSRNRSYCWQ